MQFKRTVTLVLVLANIKAAVLGPDLLHRLATERNFASVVLKGGSGASDDQQMVR